MNVDGAPLATEPSSLRLMRSSFAKSSVPIRLKTGKRYRRSAVIRQVGRRLLGLALAAWAVWAGAASAQTRAAAPDGRLAPVTLQLKWRHQFQSAGFYAAIAQGYYRDAGLAVSLRVPEAGEDPVEAVREGKATYGVGTADLIIHRAQGAPVVALAAIYQHSPLVLLARRDAGVDTVHDLVGKDVMVEPQAAAILAYLRDEQVPISRLNRVAHQFDPRALIRGDVAAMTAYQTDEPFRLRRAGIRYRIFSPRAAGIDFYGDTLFTTEQEIEEHPDRVRAFRAASMRRAIQLCARKALTVGKEVSLWKLRTGTQRVQFPPGQG